MKNIVCKIKSKIGIIYSFEDIEMTSLDETFSFINRDKYIGMCVEISKQNHSDIMHIVHFSIVKKSFNKYIYLLNDETRQKLEKTANWMNAYENICKAINSDILGYEIADKSAYSMDLPRFLEKCLKID